MAPRRGLPRWKADPAGLARREERADRLAGARRFRRGAGTPAYALFALFANSVVR